MTTERTEIIDQLHRAAGLMHRGHHRMHACMHESPHRLHHGQGRLLARLAEMDGASQRDLVDELDIRPASLTELIDKLEAAGFVERRQSEEDKRVFHIHLTEKGKQSAEAASKTRSDALGGMFAFLNAEECARLSALLGKLLQGMEQFAGADEEGEAPRHGGCRCGHGRGHGHGPHHGREPGHDQEHGHGHGRGGCGRGRV